MKLLRPAFHPSEKDTPITTTRLTVHTFKVGLGGLFALLALSTTILRAEDKAGQSVKQTEDGQKTTISLPLTVSDSSNVGVMVANTLKAGSRWDDFKTGKLGSITASQGGNFEIIFSSAEPPGTLVMHLESVSLIPRGGESSDVDAD